MHKSVLLKQACDALHIKKAEKYIDATLGAGGHTAEIIKLGGEVLGIDADEKMLELARTRLTSEGFENFTLVQGNFRDIENLAKKNGFSEVSGVLFDLGVSSVHFDSDDRGFSFKNPESPLDMRLSANNQGVTAADLLNSLPESSLLALFLSSMPYPEARRLANRVVTLRSQRKLETVADFLAVIGKHKEGKIHPATRAMQALRIAVNSELESLSEGLRGAYSLLAIEGKMAVISFHSGEDKVVKDYFRELEKEGTAKLEELVVPSDTEVNENPRARSAKLRILTKIK